MWPWEELFKLPNFQFPQIRHVDNNRIHLIWLLGGPIEVKGRWCLEKCLEHRKCSIVVAVITQFGNGTWQPHTTILAMALPKISFNLHLCFTTSWLTICFPSHSEANSAYSCWFYLSVKSPIVLKLMRVLRKSFLCGGQWHSAPVQTREHPRWFAKYFSFAKHVFL